MVEIVFSIMADRQVFSQNILGVKWIVSFESFLTVY